MRQILKNKTDKIYFTIKYRQLSVTERKSIKNAVSKLIKRGEERANRKRGVAIEVKKKVIWL